MFFSCYCGRRETATEWQKSLADHARWLDLTVHMESCCSDDTHYCGVAWLVRQTQLPVKPIMQSPAGWSCSTSTALTEPEALAAEIELAKHLAPFSFPDNPVVSYQFKTNTLEVVVPPAAGEQFHIASDGHGVMLANDLRLMRRWKSAELNPTAIYALLQFRAIPPNLALYRGVDRIPNGHRCICRVEKGDWSFVPFFLPAQSESRQALRNIGEPEAVDKLQELLDQRLLKLPKSSFLFFSGGVDSTLLAARLAALERRDVQLINFCFGPDDAEGKAALAVASLLNMPCTQIAYREQDFAEMLTRIGREYSFPFGDSSTIPMNLMVHLSLSQIGTDGSVIEGVGPDQLFSDKLIDQKWALAQSLPVWLQALGSDVYQWLELWENECRLGTLTNIIRKLRQMPRIFAQVMAINSLDGIAYKIPKQNRIELYQTIQANILDLADGLDTVDQYCLLNLIHFAVGTVGAKSCDLYRLYNLHLHVPYLMREIIELGFSLPISVRASDGVDKSLLKKLLLRSVPKEIVFRPKKGFDPPFMRMAAQPAMQDYLLHVALADQDPLLGFMRKRVLDRLYAKILQGQQLSYDAYRFTWLVLFTSIWLEQQK